MNKNKSILIPLFIIILLFSFNNRVEAATYGNTKKIGFKQDNMNPTAAEAKIDGKWLKNPKYNVACKYVFAAPYDVWNATKSMDFVIVQFSYDSKDPTKYEINYSTDTWSNTWKSRFKASFKDYDPKTQITKTCPKMYFEMEYHTRKSKEDYLYVGPKYTHIGNYTVTFNVSYPIDPAKSQVAEASEPSGQSGQSGNECTSSVSWLQEPSSTGKRFSCVYSGRETTSSPCILVQMNFSVPATFGGDKASIPKGTDEEVTFKSNLSTIDKYKRKKEVKTGETGFYVNLLNKIQSENSKKSWACPANINLRGLITDQPTIAINATNGINLELVTRTEGATNQEIKEEIEAANKKSYIDHDPFEDFSLLGDLTEEDLKKQLSCKDLFENSKDLKNMIKLIINIIRIAVPIILIVFGVIDFGKAVFSSSEDTMKKAQGAFIKRIIIAVCILLVPTILKILLTIANQIWPSISADFCGIL